MNGVKGVFSLLEAPGFLNQSNKPHGSQERPRMIFKPYFLWRDHRRLQINHLVKANVNPYNYKKRAGIYSRPFEHDLYLTTARIDIATRINVTAAGINTLAATRIDRIATSFRGF